MIQSTVYYKHAQFDLNGHKHTKNEDKALPLLTLLSSK